MVLILGSYLLAGRLGLSLAYLHASATPVWPPTGIALAGFLLVGKRVWPAVLLGAFLVNVTTAGSVAASLGIAIGNTLEGAVGARLVERFAGGVRAFDSTRNVFRFTLLAGLCATALGATIGVTTLAVGGDVGAAGYLPVWWTWWLGDAAGALVVTPALVLWVQSARARRTSAESSALRDVAAPSEAWTAARGLEVALVCGALLLAGEIVFGLGFTPSPGHNPLEFLCVPPLVWAAFRFGPRETATAGVLLSAIAIRATLRGDGPFARPSPNESLLLLQAYLAVTVVTSLAVAAAVRARRVAEARARELNDELEGLVARRTAELRAANADLVREVDRHRRTEEELKQSEARLVEAQHLAHIGSFEWDVDADRVWWSDELYRIYGMACDGATRRLHDVLACIHADDRARVQAAIEMALRERRSFEVEYRAVHPDGSVRIVASQGHVSTGDRGAPLSIIGTAQDITERKRAESERVQLVREQAARHEAEEANRTKDEFLAVLSHELRTPLSAVLGWAQLLRSGTLDAETSAKALDTIVRNAQVQTKLISDILDVSRIVSGKIPLERKEVDLATLVEGVVESLQPSAASRGVVVGLAVEAHEALVAGDPARLQQIVWNVLSNAIKFAPARAGRVDVTVRGAGRYVEVVVADNGPGIEPEFLPHVFERFRQADASTTRRQGGLGLGLAIVRHLVEMHGGSVRAMNRSDGRGASFTVALPSASEMDASATFDSAQPDAAIDAELNGVRVLVVDDEPDARELLRTLLQRWGVRAATSASVQDALAAIERNPPDLVLTDIGMPGEDGFALLRRVRALPRERGGEVPVAAVTAYASQDDRQRVLGAGFRIHLTKPLHAAELRRAVIELARESGALR